MHLIKFLLHKNQNCTTKIEVKDSLCAIQNDPKRKLCHLADVPVAAISSPSDLPQKVLVTFFRCLGKGERRAEACSLSGDNVEGIKNL